MPTKTTATTRKTTARKTTARKAAARPEADVTDGLRPARKTTARKPATANALASTAKTEAKLLAELAEVDAEIRRITALREQRTAVLLKARAAGISYSRLAEAMGGIPTGNVHAIVKAAGGTGR
jgi:DNA-directed RNA polymerase specialized sigma24 family protein